MTKWYLLIPAFLYASYANGDRWYGLITVIFVFLALWAWSKDFRTKTSDDDFSNEEGRR